MNYHSFRICSMKYCRCIPWDMVRNNTGYDYELCDIGGNSCFWQRMQAKEIMAKECFCLSDCSNVKYTHSTTLKPYNMESQCSLGWSGMDHLFSTISLWSQRALVLSKILVAKICEKILSEFMIADMAEGRDPSQYGNLKGVSVNHYLIKMI